jgi:two-component system cell cycle response regulator DivK
MDRRQPRRPPSRPLVLIVDDDPDTREMYIVGLSAVGCDATSAAESDAAFLHAWRMHPDIIVTDLTLPGGDGWDLLGRLKQDPRTRDIPVVVLTGHTGTALQARAEQEGCAAFLLKPCLPEELAAVVRAVLESSVITTQSRSAGGDTANQEVKHGKTNPRPAVQ